MRRKRIKKIVTAICLVCALAGICICAAYLLRGPRAPGLRVRADLLVNGKTTGEKLVIYEHEQLLADLPFTSVLRELGYSVEWIDDETAVIRIDGREYRYDGRGLYSAEAETVRFDKPKEGSVPGGSAEGERTDLITPGEGYSVSGAYLRDRVLYMPAPTFLATMERLGVEVELTLDAEHRQVLVRSVP